MSGDLSEEERDPWTACVQDWREVLIALEITEIALTRWWDDPSLVAAMVVPMLRGLRYERRPATGCRHGTWRSSGGCLRLRHLNQHDTIEPQPNDRSA